MKGNQQIFPSFNTKCLIKAICEVYFMVKMAIDSHLPFGADATSYIA
jgi:hypothetical protein